MKRIYFLPVRIKSLLLFVVLLTAPVLLYSQDNETCLGCHDDPDIKMEKNGVEHSLTVKRYTLPRSIHARNKCVGCHVGFNPDAIPHKDTITPVNCTKCHTDPSSFHIFHPNMINASGMGGRADVNCKGCHGTHDILAPTNPSAKTNFANATNFCGNCHKKEKTDHLMSEHYLQVKKNNPNSPTCLYCHSYPVTPGYDFSGAELKVNQEELCLSCHLTSKGKENMFSSRLIDYDKSVHGSAIKRGNKNAAVCIDCHGTHKLERREVKTSSINHFNIPKLCGKCHKDITNEYMVSTHGVALQKGNIESPTCTYCHGEHNIQAVPVVPKRVFVMNNFKESVYTRNKMVFCLACHGNEEMMKKYNISTVAEAHDWLPDQEIHWALVRCIDCHSSYDPPNLSHNILPPAKTIKKCEQCHSLNSILLTKLYKHEKEQSRKKYGFINGTILSDAYVIGTTRNIYVDYLSGIIFGMTVLGIGGHAFLRWRAKRKRNDNDFIIYHG